MHILTFTNLLATAGLALAAIGMVKLKLAKSPDGANRAVVIVMCGSALVLARLLNHLLQTG